VRRTKEEAEETKRKILDAAVELFEMRGYTATRIEDIAEKTGMTRGAVYWHFKNKYELFFYILELFERRLDLLLSESKKVASSPIMRLQWLIINMITRSDILVGCRQIWMIAISEFINKNKLKLFQKRSKKIAGKFINSFKGLVEEGITDGEVRGGVDSENAALMIALFITGAVGIHVKKPELTSVEWNVHRIVDLFLTGIKA
jgi:TetR/AcrR family acrAB operon transcriptional repressor